jgi:hypothetical protein
MCTTVQPLPPDCTRGRSVRVRLDLTLDAPVLSANRLSTSAAHALLRVGIVGLSTAPTLDHPSLCSSNPDSPAAVAVLAAAAEAARVDNPLAGLADIGTKLPEGTELFVGRISFAVEGAACSLPPAYCSPPRDFAALAAEY